MTVPMVDVNTQATWKVTQEVSLYYWNVASTPLDNQLTFEKQHFK